MDEYEKKRNFDRTPEPRDGGSAEADGRRFVIQEHDASTLHYDFRIQVGDRMPSWAIPKGPSTDPGEKRLAVRTEDHPIDYADFEGVIPEGEYGAGVVMVWDTGSYRNLTEDEDGQEVAIEDAVDAGHLAIWLSGEKLEGGWALTQAKLGGEEDNWLFVKMDDEKADARRNPVNTEATSVKTGRSLAQIREEESEEAEGGQR